MGKYDQITLKRLTNFVKLFKDTCGYNKLRGIEFHRKHDSLHSFGSSF
jgi:hypothetical protein